MDCFILLNHEFILGIQTGDLADVYTSYSTFTKTIVALFHAEHNKSEVHSALIVAEDQLTVILEDATHLDDSFMRFVDRAIRFIRRYIERIREWIRVNFPSTKCNAAVVTGGISENSSRADDATDIRWDGKFTELVELIFALLISGKLSSDTDAGVIRSIFQIFGVKKSMTDYYKTLKKIEEKNPKDEDSPGRCKLLERLLRDTEKELQKKYLGKAA